MNSVSKNVYIDKFDDIVNKYNNTYCRTIKMKPADVKSSIYIDFNKENNKKVPLFKLIIMLEYQNIKIFMKKVTLQIDLKKYFL